MWADGRAVDFLSSGLGHMDVVARLADGRGWCVCVCGGARRAAGRGGCGATWSLVSGRLVVLWFLFCVVVLSAHQTGRGGVDGL